MRSGYISVLPEDKDECQNLQLIFLSVCSLWCSTVTYCDRLASLSGQSWKLSWAVSAKRTQREYVVCCVVQEWLDTPCQDTVSSATPWTRLHVWNQLVKV